jgi:hypothetical protein
MTFHSDSLISWTLFGDYDDGLTAMPCTPEYLFKRFRLKRILDCDMLKNITIEHAGYHRDAAVEAGEKLGEAFVEKFANKSPKQEVTVRRTRQPPRPSVRRSSY